MLCFSTTCWKWEQQVLTFGMWCRCRAAHSMVCICKCALAALWTCEVAVYLHAVLEVNLFLFVDGVDTVPMSSIVCWANIFVTLPFCCIAPRWPSPLKCLHHRWCGNSFYCLSSSLSTDKLTSAIVCTAFHWTAGLTSVVRIVTWRVMHWFMGCVRGFGMQMK